MKFAAAFSLPLVVSFVLVQTATRLVGVPETPASAQPQSIVWAGRVFVTHAEFARWLHARGRSYAVWALKHPALATGKHPVEATGTAQLNRDRTVRLLRSLVIGSVIAALAFLAITPIAYRLRRRRGLMYVPALAGHRRWLVEVAARPLSRSSNGAGHAAITDAAPPRRRGTPVFPRTPAQRLERLLGLKEGRTATAEEEAADEYGTPVFPQAPVSGLDLLLPRRARWYVAAAFLGAGLGTVLGYVLS